MWCWCGCLLAWLTTQLPGLHWESCRTKAMAFFLPPSRLCRKTVTSLLLLQFTSSYFPSAATFYLLLTPPQTQKSSLFCDYSEHPPLSPTHTAWWVGKTWRCCILTPHSWCWGYSRTDKGCKCWAEIEWGFHRNHVIRVAKFSSADALFQVQVCKLPFVFGLEL